MTSKVTGEYKARGYYAVATAPSKEDSYALYVEYMDRLGYDPVEPDNRVDVSEYKISLLTNMINAPYSRGGKKTAEVYSAEVRRQWQSLGGKTGKRGADGAKSPTGLRPVENSEQKSSKKSKKVQKTS